MIALVFEVYGAFCLLSLLAFLVLALVAKLRPDLDEDLDEFEKLKKLASSVQFGNALPIEDLIIKDPSRSQPSRTVKPSKRLIQRRPHLIPLRSGGNRP
jgi:hypothetical protein